jgi:hypothetical protein
MACLSGRYWLKIQDARYDEFEEEEPSVLLVNVNI